jgi:hypothetical protein
VLHSAFLLSVLQSLGRRCHRGARIGLCVSAS